MTNRYVEVNIDKNNELMRITCPHCEYPMRVLSKDKNNVYQCYCACCQTDRYMKDTKDNEKLTFKEFDRCMKRGKGIDLERISDLVYELHDKIQELTDKNNNYQDKINDLESEKILDKKAFSKFMVDESHLINHYKSVLKTYEDFFMYKNIDLQEVIDFKLKYK